MRNKDTTYYISKNEKFKLPLHTDSGYFGEITAGISVNGSVPKQISAFSEKETIGYTAYHYSPAYNIEAELALPAETGVFEKIDTQKAEYTVSTGENYTLKITNGYEPINNILLFNSGKIRVSSVGRVMLKACYINTGTIDTETFIDQEIGGAFSTDFSTDFQVAIPAGSSNITQQIIEAGYYGVLKSFAGMQGTTVRQKFTAIDGEDTQVVNLAFEVDGTCLALEYTDAYGNLLNIPVFAYIYGRENDKIQYNIDMVTQSLRNDITENITLDFGYLHNLDERRIPDIFSSRHLRLVYENGYFDLVTQDTGYTLKTYGGDSTGEHVEIGFDFAVKHYTAV